MRLDATPPFDLRQSARALTSFDPAKGDQEVRGDRIRKAFALPDGTAALATVTPTADGVELDGPAELAPYVRDWLGLDDDLRPFLELAADDPPTAELLTTVAGLHQVRFAGLAESVAYFILTHRTRQASAIARKRRLAVEFGPSVEVDGQRFVAFPTLDRLAGLSPAELDPFTGRPQQTEYLHAALVGVHDLGAEFLTTAPYGEAFKALREIRGIGEFTASAVLMRGLGRPDFIPLEMAQFGGALTSVYGPAADVATVRERYGRYQGWWSYLARTALGWRSRGA